MLALLLSWIIISFVLITIGDGLVFLYKKTTKKFEEYNLVEKFLLGTSAILIPLSLWSLWLPSNHLFLTPTTLLCILYWITRRDALCILLKQIKKQINNLSHAEIAALFFFVFVLLISCSWIENVFDSEYYHYQNIRWNEELAVVPGLANLDHRYAFNSNYLLLSAIFTFRSVFGEAIYGLQSTITILIFAWVLYELFQSKYEIKRVIILATFSLMHMVSIKFTLNTSTDILPNLAAFYLISKTILYPNFLREKTLSSLIIPILLITCKLSMAPFALISLYTAYWLMKEKRFKPLFFAIIFNLLITSLWMIRNIYISGYLAFPIYSIDLFSFDWKLPKNIVEQEMKYIHRIGMFFLEINTIDLGNKLRDPRWVNI